MDGSGSAGALGRWLVLGWLLAAVGCGGSEARSGVVVDLVTDLAPGTDFSQAEVELLDGRGRTVARASESALLGQRWQWPPRRVAEMVDLAAGDYALRVALRDAGGRTVLGRRYTFVLRADRLRRVLAVLSRACVGVNCPGPGDEPTRTECLGGWCVPPACVDGDEDACDVVPSCEEGTSCDAGRPGCPGQCLAGLCWPACPAPADGGAPDGGSCTASTECADLVCPACQQPDCRAGRCVCVPVADGTGCGDDGVACTVDLCVEGACRHEPDDGRCPEGSCDAARGCVECLSDAHCDDGNECTADRCVDGVCVVDTLPDGTSCSCGTCQRGSCVRRFRSVALGSQHTCALDAGGTLLCWGRNQFGQLGLGDTDRRTEPTRVGAAGGWQQVDAGGASTCGVKTDGTLYCWGFNDRGQLGLGGTTDRLVPTQVARRGSWQQVSASGNTACGVLVTSTGTSTGYCWGANDNGQLGLGDTADRRRPTELATRRDWSRVVAGRTHACGVTADGTLLCWGSNRFGKLGLPSGGGSEVVPQQVGTTSDWAFVSVGLSHTCGVKTDGTLLCWGRNQYGQLGLGTGEDTGTPMAVRGDGSWQQVSADRYHTCGVKTDGTLLCWGGNTFGQLGLGDDRPRNEPTQVGTEGDWELVAVGVDHSCALKTDGTLLCWGSNQFGQLGMSDDGVRLAPVVVAGGTCP